ncbi:MAG: cob(I)yrinic acid a,c-diamide adenosyltransferase [Gemmatimonadaceae bacterium]|nr:cob(I)yrinic acid a,c-diamide adenosyltransferase [Gemmatimonadaceae bacterium]
MTDRELPTSEDADEPRTDPLAAPKQSRLANGRTVPTPKQKRPGPYRVPPRANRHGLLIVNTGDGKGKTTAALGVMLRAHGRGMHTGMFQFVKRLTNTGEHRVARRFGIEMVALGAGCTKGKKDRTQDAALAREGWVRCAEHLAAGTFDVLILDELTLPLAWGWLDENEVISALANRVQGTHVIVTGRHASQALIDAADLVTDMRVIKHPYRTQGIKAQGGIDV